MLKPIREIYSQQEFDATKDPNDRHLMEIHNTRARRLRGLRFRRLLEINLRSITQTGKCGMIKQTDLSQAWRQYRDVRQAPMTPNSQETLFTPAALAGMLLEEAKLDAITAMLRACSERSRNAGTSIGDLYGMASTLLSVVVEEEGQIIHAANEFLGVCNGK